MVGLLSAVFAAASMSPNRLPPPNTLMWSQLDVPSYRHHLCIWRNGALQIVRFDTIAANSIKFISDNVSIALP